MISQLKRKIGQVASDRVLRKWLVGRMLGRYQAPAAFEPHHPPYLHNQLPLSPETPKWQIPPKALSNKLAVAQTSIQIFSQQLALDPESPRALFNEPIADIEAELARHRFAWIPLTPQIDAAWFVAIWHAWRDQFMNSNGWAWHPYTAAERAVNLIDGARRCGAPDTLDVFAQDLATHTLEIARQLEYFGDHDTSNHLANNGRGLYRIGCALDLSQSRHIGFEILCHEAKRIVLEGGSLREGSTHYHMLYVRNYLDVWLAAVRHQRIQEAEQLKEIAKRLIAVAKSLVLPGGLPLIGDISPDCPAAYLAGIHNGVCAWTNTLPKNEQHLVKTLAGEVLPAPFEQLQNDGWARADIGQWSMLTSAPLNGWPFMPGHAHQDISGAEIHLNKQPLFVDPGRGEYGETGDAALYRSSAVHGGIRIDHQDPYPANKPYYSDAFRQSVAGPASTRIMSDGISISHDGYRRLGINTVTRSWTFSGSTMHIADTIQAEGTHYIEQSFVTPHVVKIEPNKVIIGDSAIIRVSGEPPSLRPVTIWQAYGSGITGTQIVFEETTTGPWHGTLEIESII